MSSCPCCSYPLLRHIRHNQMDWFCQHCWQFMPNFSHRIGSRANLTDFSNQGEVISSDTGWNRELDRHPHVVSLSDSNRFKNAKTSPEKSRLLV